MRYYTEDHEWIEQKNGDFYVGITDYAQSELGDIVFVDAEDSLGEHFSANEVFGSIEAVKTVSDLQMPVSGTIVQINSTLENNPEHINIDPYDRGWIIAIHPDDENDVRLLMIEEEYFEYIEK